MWITADTETQGLNARKFVLGVLYFENGKHEVYNTKKKMYNRIKEIGSHQQEKGETLTVYAHNMQYDYISMGAWEDPSNIIFCPRPFIADTYCSNEQGELEPYIKWVDTCGFWRGSLDSLGQAIGETKSTTPEWLKQDEYEPDFLEIAQATQYCVQDCKVLMEFLQGLKKRLWKEGIRPRRMITLPQVAISYLMSHLRKEDTPEFIGKDPLTGWKKSQGRYLYNMEQQAFFKSQYSDDVLEAYRGGRVQAFQVGGCKEANYEDVNSLYPYAASNMEYPLLTTEKKYYRTMDSFLLDEILDMYGISHCIVETPRQEGVLGYLPVRQYKEGEWNNETTYYPETDEEGRKVLIGTWTHLELAQAVKLGYEIKHIFHTITWQRTANPLSKLFNKLYTLRKEAKKDGESFDDTYYKLLMNSMIGKLAQRRPHKQLLKVDIEELPKYREEGWIETHTHGTEVIIYKEEGIDYKKYYAPILATYVTAYARDYLYKHLKRIPRDRLWYTDTDSILYDSVYSSTTVFLYGEGIGEWKREHSGEPLHIYRRKAYSIGPDVKLARVPKRYISKENFLEGTIHYEDILGIKQTKDKELVGTRVQRTCELDYEEHIQLPRLNIDTRTTLTDAKMEKIKEYL